MFDFANAPDERQEEPLPFYYVVFVGILFSLPTGA